ncbi:hypothetical protein BD289DRAFT_267906 [Coniella lustricola]|uniref:Uncharacterized protein n=1 Tax=Coniella lustricola TaxID=2025994 RepID=A0A2T3A737_9PEZI|nr:hypothetical protein BD289DRAFT_267906 [Coniella lustricola]
MFPLEVLLPKSPRISKQTRPNFSLQTAGWLVRSQNVLSATAPICSATQPYAGIFIFHFKVANALKRAELRLACASSRTNCTIAPTGSGPTDGHQALPRYYLSKSNICALLKGRLLLAAPFMVQYIGGAWREYPILTLDTTCLMQVDRDLACGTGPPVHTQVVQCSEKCFEKTRNGMSGIQDGVRVSIVYAETKFNRLTCPNQSAPREPSPGDTLFFEVQRTFVGAMYIRHGYTMGTVWVSMAEKKRTNRDNEQRREKISVACFVPGV